MNVKKKKKEKFFPPEEERGPHWACNTGGPPINSHQDTAENGYIGGLN